MASATDLITLALHHAGITGIGQTPQAQDLADAYSILTQMMDDWQLERSNVVNPVPIIKYPDLTTIVIQPFGYDNAITWGLAARFRAAWMLPPDDAINNLAKNGYNLVQSINRQQSAGAVPAATTTALQLIQLALRMARRSTDQQRVADDSIDVSDAFALLCQMLAQWQRKRWLIPSLAEIVIPSTGALSYQFGPVGGGFNPAFFNPAFFVTGGVVNQRVDRIENAFVRLSNPGLSVDYPLYIIESREEYNRISVKSLSTFPQAVFYDAAYPTANLYFWPIPAAGQFEMHVFVKAALQQFAAVTDTLNASPEYVEAMLYNLAVRIAMTMGTDVPPNVSAMARASLNTIRMANIQVPELLTPGALIGPARNRSGYRGFLTGGSI